MLKKGFVSLLVAALAPVALTLPASAQDTQGPSSSQSPYLVSTQPDVMMRSILTVGDQGGVKPDGSPYVMAGIPDGLGAYDNLDGTFSVLMNHEISTGRGAVRAHGATGAFISRFVIRKSDLAVMSGGDLIQQIATFNPASATYNAPQKGIQLNRLCSADLPAPTAFFDPVQNVGYNGRIFMNGEESGSEGRAFAHLLDGTSYELPRLGKFSWENSVAHPNAGNKTIVIGTDDGTGGQIYIYVGQKTNSGGPIDRAGLTNGTLYGLRVNGVAAESSETGIPKGLGFSLQSFGNVESLSGAALESQSVMTGVTSFLRPEDAAWNPSNTNEFYFNTTNAFNKPSRLWRLRFDDSTNPQFGGTIEAVLDGTEGQQMLDNLAINGRNQAILQEDPGNQTYLAKVRQYDFATDTLRTIAEHDPTRFLPGGARFLTQDEESSGVIDVSSILGPDTYLLDVQAHYPLAGELVEGGQLLALRIVQPVTTPPVVIPPVVTPPAVVPPVAPPIAAPPVAAPPVAAPPRRQPPPSQPPPGRGPQRPGRGPQRPGRGPHAPVAAAAEAKAAAAATR